MNRAYLIFKHEFLQAVKKVGFIVLTFIVPVLALLAIGVFELVTTLTEPSASEVTTASRRTPPEHSYGSLRFRL